MRINVWVRLFLITLGYYAALYFSVNNRSLLVLTAVYAVIVWRSVGRVGPAFFYAFLATLPFAKGQAYEITMLPVEDIPRWALYGIKYFFPVYVSDIFLGLSLYVYIRNRLSLQKNPSLPFWPIVVFTLFILWGVFGGLQSQFPEVGLFSGIQLIRLFVILCLPSILHVNDDIRKGVISVFTATLFFESTWAMLQVVHGGPLGRDIEVYLPSSRLGIGSSENRDLLRVNGTFFEPSILGTFLLSQLGVLAVYVVRNKQQIFPRLWFIAIGTLASVALVFTGSRGLYALWVVFAWYLWRLWRESSKPTVALSAFAKKWLIIGAIILGSFLVPYLGVRVRSLTDVLSEYGSASYRLQMMQYAVKIAAVYPWFGVGLGQSPYYFATMFPDEHYVFDPTYPHNLFFQILMETGIVGVALFLLFLGSLVRYARREHILENPYSIGAALYLLCAMSYPIFLNHQEIISYLFVYIGLAVASMKQT